MNCGIELKYWCCACHRPTDAGACGRNHGRQEKEQGADVSKQFGRYVLVYGLHIALVFGFVKLLIFAVPYKEKICRWKKTILHMLHSLTCSLFNLFALSSFFFVLRYFCYCSSLRLKYILFFFNSLVITWRFAVLSHISRLRMPALSEILDRRITSS